jgi:hypothetical protein
MVRHWGALAAACLTLAACDAPIVYYRHAYTYMPGEFAYAGDLYLDVIGNPYKVPQEQFDRTLADTMSGGVWGTPVRFVTARNPESRSPYKVVMVFDPPWYASYDRLCVQPEMVKPLPPGPGNTKLSAALCRSDYPISYVYAGFVSQGPNDPAFRSAIQQIELALLPARNEHIDQNGGDSDGRR